MGGYPGGMPKKPSSPCPCIPQQFPALGAGRLIGTLPVWSWDWIVLWDGLVPWLGEWHWVGGVPLQQQGAGGGHKAGCWIGPPLLQ